MVTEMKPVFRPTYVTAPGATLVENLDFLQMSQREFADRVGLTPKTINEIAKGIAPITPETAIKFEHVLGVPASFWISLESKFQEHLAQKKELEVVSKSATILEKFPVKELIERGLLPKGDSDASTLTRLMAFFNVGSPKALESYCMKLAANFRAAKNPKRSPFAVASWIQIGKRRADSIKTKPFNKTAFRVALSNIRSLTSQRPEKFVPALTNECAKVGVAVVFEPELKHTSLSGITCWATKDKALLQLSLRYKSNDHLWFTFFHESAHLLMHNKKEIFVHELGEKNQNEKEVEADLFSRDFLIPKAEFGRLLKKKVTKDWIREFSNSIGIAPGVVVGRLQHDGHITHAEHNDLKEYYQWSHD